MTRCPHHLLLYSCLFFLISCDSNKEGPQKDSLGELDLKRGEIVSCSPANKQFGTTSFTADVPENLRGDFDIAVAQLHSFEYDEAEKMFAKVIDQAPGCAMAYWGVAMANFHPLWAPPAEEELLKGEKALQIARSITKKTKRESDYIEAIGSFYAEHDKLDHRSRVLNFEKAMEKIYTSYPDDKEAPVFYALALNAAADPTDKTYTRQKKAYGILNALFEKEPLHPGIAHYIIHNYDYPGLAALALPAARKYASIAPASAHALHMPSHIFTRLGLWDECISSNIVAAAAAICYAEQAKIKGHWDEELHMIDYLIYAYLQKGEDVLAKELGDYLRSITEVYPVNFKVLYTFAASPARYFLEKRMWKEAAALELYPANFPWDKFSWQKAVVHFARGLGAIRTGQLEPAKKELAMLISLQLLVNKQKNMSREAAQVIVQIKTLEAWIQYKEGNNEQAIATMTTAANLEDGTEKHPVTPGEILPARELLGDMLLEMNKPVPSLAAYESVLESHPNRFNALYSAGLAAQQSGNKSQARLYFTQLLESIGQSATTRSELATVRSYLNTYR